MCETSEKSVCFSDAQTLGARTQFRRISDATSEYNAVRCLVDQCRGVRSDRMRVVGFRFRFLKIDHACLNFVIVLSSAVGEGPVNHPPEAPFDAGKTPWIGVLDKLQCSEQDLFEIG